MREILFKGKKVDSEEWIKGGFYREPNDDIKDGVSYIIGGSLYDVGSAYAVIPETVSEYSGMPDKFGNRIFEGDIIEITLPLSGCKPIIEKSEVYFDQGCFCVNWHGTRTRMDSFASHVTFEIIGNVFDNPELLKGGE